MKRCLFIIVFLFGSNCLAFDYNVIQDNSEVVYSPAFLQWSQASAHRDDIVFKKSEVGYITDSVEIKLNSDFQFLYLGRFFGVDNSMLKYYELEYINDSFVERPLNYDEVQEIFADFDVLKISDFNRGSYTIINHCDEKYILLYNDTEESFANYVVLPEVYFASFGINGIIRLPDRGKILFMNKEEPEKQVYTIRVR